MIELVLIYILGVYFSLKWFFKRILKDSGGVETSIFVQALIFAVAWPVSILLIMWDLVETDTLDKIIKHFKP